MWELGFSIQFSSRIVRFRCPCFYSMRVINTNFCLWKCCFVMPGVLKREGNMLNAFKSAKTFPSLYIFLVVFFFNLFNSTPFFRKSIEKLCAMSYVFILQPPGFRAVFPQSSGARRKPKLEPLEAAGWQRLHSSGAGGVPAGHGTHRGSPVSQLFRSVLVCSGISTATMLSALEILKHSFLQ